MWVTRQKKTQSVRISVIINNNTFTNIFIRIILTILTGTISKAEAREALRKHKGNIWASVTECVEGRQQKVAILQMLLVENHDLVHDSITKVVAGKFSVQHDDIEAGGEGNEAVAVRSM